MGRSRLSRGAHEGVSQAEPLTLTMLTVGRIRLDEAIVQSLWPTAFILSLRGVKAIGCLGAIRVTRSRSERTPGTGKGRGHQESEELNKLSDQVQLGPWRPAPDAPA